LSHHDDQSQSGAATTCSILQDLLVDDRRVRPLVGAAHLHGANACNGDTDTRAHGGANDHDRQRMAASRLRAQPGDGMWTRSRRARGMLGVFYPGTSARLLQLAGIAASRQ
jgi:hypothetical protein